VKDKTGRPQSEVIDRRNFHDLERRSRYIPADSITTLHIIDSSITTVKIEDDAVDNSKIGDSAVDTDQLAANAVTLAKVDSDVVAEMIKFGFITGG